MRHVFGPELDRVAGIILLTAFIATSIITVVAPLFA